MSLTASFAELPTAGLPLLPSHQSPGHWTPKAVCALLPWIHLMGLGCSHQFTCLNCQCQSCLTALPVILLLMEGREEKGR